MGLSNDRYRELGEATEEQIVKPSFGYTDIVLPGHFMEGVDLPTRAEHVLGISLDAHRFHLQFRKETAKWSKFLMDENRFIFGQAGDNNFSWRWNLPENVGNVHIVSCYFSQRLITETGYESLGLNSSTFDFNAKLGETDRLITNLIRSLRSAYTLGQQPQQLYIDAVVQMLIVHLLTQYGTVKTGIRHYKKGLSAKALRLTADYLNANYTKTIRVEELANLCHISQFHFSRLFLQSMGCSPYQYVLQLRIENAQKLLISTQMTIESIALKLGYKSAYHFSRQFKSRVGVSPRAFREKRV